MQSTFRRLLNKDVRFIEKKFAQKKYDQVINFVENKLDEGYREQILYYFLGLTNVFINNLNEAKIYLEKAQELNPKDINTLNALAYIDLKEHKSDSAITKYLEILDIDPKNKIALKNLKRFKKNRNIEEIYSTLNPDDYQLFNYKSKSSSIQTFLFFTAIIMSIVIILLIVNKLFLSKKNNINNQDETNKTRTIKLEKQLHSLSKELAEDYEYSLDKMYNNLSEDNINEFILLLNKLRYSDIELTEKLRIISKYDYQNKVRVNNVVNSLTYEKINSEASYFFFDEVYIKWIGKIRFIDDEVNNKIYINVLKQDNSLSEDSIAIKKIEDQQLFNNLSEDDYIEVLGQIDALVDKDAFEINSNQIEEVYVDL